MIPAGPKDGRAPGSHRRAWWIGVSVLLHLLALGGILFLTRRPPPIDQAAPSYDLVFDGTGSNVQPTSPDRGESQPRSDDTPEMAPSPSLEPTPPADPPPPAASPAPPEPVLPGPASPSPTSPPAPDAAPVPSAPPQTPPPEAVPQQSMPPVPETPFQPDIRLDVPAPTPPAPPMVPELEMPPPPPLPVPPVPAPQAAARPPAPRPRTAPPPGTFANPMDLSFNQTPRRGERQAAPRMGAAPGSAASRSMDFSLGAPKAGPNRSEAFFDARARNLGADWMQGVHQFWLRHRYYPRQAAENGEDGTVDIELTVDRTGRVQSVAVTSRSGSSWIDMAAVSTFRGAQLPPIPAEIDAPYKTTLTINYLLLR